MQAGGLQRRDAPGIEQFMIKVNRDARQRGSFALPRLIPFIKQQAARQIRFCLHRRFQRHVRERRQQRRSHALPQRFRRMGDGAASFRLATGSGFNFDIRHHAVAATARRHVGKQRQRFAVERLAEPAARIQLRQFIPRQLARYAPAVAGAIQRVVVQQKNLLILRQLRVELDHGMAPLRADVDRRQGIFRGQFAAAAMGDDMRIGPAVCAHSRRFPVVESK